MTDTQQHMHAQDPSSIEDLRNEIARLREVTYEHHWRLQTLEAEMRKRVAVAEARAALLESGRTARQPGMVSRSQYGEDGVLWELFDGQLEGTYVEAGAIDGLQLSVTALFEAVGWRGLLIEPIPEQAARCKANRPANHVIQAALAAPGHAPTTHFVHFNGAPEFSGINPSEDHRVLASNQGGSTEQIEVTQTTLDDALKNASADAWNGIDFVVLDLEGGELDTLRGFNLDHWRPRVLIIEDHDRSPSSPIAQYMENRGYEAVGMIRINRVYIRLEEQALLQRASCINWL